MILWVGQLNVADCTERHRAQRQLLMRNTSRQMPYVATRARDITLVTVMPVQAAAAFQPFRTLAAAYSTL